MQKYKNIIKCSIFRILCVFFIYMDIALFVVVVILYSTLSNTLNGSKYNNILMLLYLCKSPGSVGGEWFFLVFTFSLSFAVFKERVQIFFIILMRQWRQNESLRAWDDDAWEYITTNY